MNICCDLLWAFADSTRLLSIGYFREYAKEMRLTRRSVAKFFSLYRHVDDTLCPFIQDKVLRLFGCTHSGLGVKFPIISYAPSDFALIEVHAVVHSPGTESKKHSGASLEIQKCPIS